MGSGASNDVSLSMRVRSCQLRWDTAERTHRGLVYGSKIHFWSRIFIAMPNRVPVRPSVQVPDDSTPVLAATHDRRPGTRCCDACYTLIVSSEEVRYGQH